MVTERWLFEGELRPVAEMDAAGNVVSRFVYATRVKVPEYMIRGGVTYRIIADQLGSPRLIVNTATGQVTQRLDYDEFGNVTDDNSPGFQPFGFAGGLMDSAVGLVRFGVRDYDPNAGRWSNRDPIRFKGGSGNLYSYGSSDPVNRADRSGLLAYFVGEFVLGEALEEVLASPRVPPEITAGTAAPMQAQFSGESLDLSSDSPRGLARS